METIEFEVTRKDLKNSYADGACCPIASAIKRSVGHTSVSVGTGFVKVSGVWYKLESKLNRLAKSRARSWRGLVLGGFKGELTAAY